MPMRQQVFAGEFAGDHEGLVVLDSVEIGALGERGAKTVRRPASNCKTFTALRTALMSEFFDFNLVWDYRLSSLCALLRTRLPNRTASCTGIAGVIAVDFIRSSCGARPT